MRTHDAGEAGKRSKYFDVKSSHLHEGFGHDRHRPAMKVSMAKHGGQLAALYLGRPPKVVNTDHLPAAKSSELAAFVHAATAGAASADPREPRPDETSYTIIVEDGSNRNVLKQSDSTMTSTFQDLVDWIERQPG